MRGRALLTTLAAPAACAAVAAGCGAAGHTSTAAPSRGAPVAQAECLGGPAAPKVTPYTLGVFRAGPPTLGLQFTDMSGYGPGLSAVRFPACPGRQAIGGGLAVHARGCAGLHVSTPVTPPVPVLIPIGNSLAGCPRAGARLPSASFPYLGIACRLPNGARCDRVRIGVHLARPALLVTVQVDGRLVSLSPPTDPGSDLWQGALLGAGPRHGPLRVRARDGYWYGEPPVQPRVRVTAYFADGTAATHAGVGYLHAGYG